jgi:hypothetical protein
MDMKPTKTAPVYNVQSWPPAMRLESGPLKWCSICALGQRDDLAIKDLLKLRADLDTSTCSSRIVGSQITEHLGLSDQMGLMGRLGLLPTPETTA